MKQMNASEIHTIHYKQIAGVYASYLAKKAKREPLRSGGSPLFDIIHSIKAFSLCIKFPAISC